MLGGSGGCGCRNGGGKAISGSPKTSSGHIAEARATHTRAPKTEPTPSARFWLLTRAWRLVHRLSRAFAQPTGFLILASHCSRSRIRFAPLCLVRQPATRHPPRFRYAVESAPAGSCLIPLRRYQMKSFPGQAHYLPSGCPRSSGTEPLSRLFTNTRYFEILENP